MSVALGTRHRRTSSIPIQQLIVLASNKRHTQELLSPTSQMGGTERPITWRQYGQITSPQQTPLNVKRPDMCCTSSCHMIFLEYYSTLLSCARSRPMDTCFCIDRPTHQLHTRVETVTVIIANKSTPNSNLSLPKLTSRNETKRTKNEQLSQTPRGKPTQWLAPQLHNLYSIHFRPLAHIQKHRFLHVLVDNKMPTTGELSQSSPQRNIFKRERDTAYKHTQRITSSNTNTSGRLAKHDACYFCILFQAKCITDLSVVTLSASVFGSRSSSRSTQLHNYKQKRQGNVHGT